MGWEEYYDTVKSWYDGYRFGDVEVYCPWDVINFCSDHRTDPKLAPKNYWANTSGNSVISHFIESVNEPHKLTKGIGTIGERRNCAERNQSRTDL